MKKNYFLILISTLLFSFSSISVAETTTDTEEEKVKPDADKENELENVDINIIKQGDKIIETYSTNGVVYKVKITPSSGPAYYLYDTDGNGSLETISNKVMRETSVQQWKIFEW